MKNKAITYTAVTTLLVLITIGVLNAKEEESTNDNMPLIREALLVNKHFFIAENMDLTVTEINAFWPVYDKYQKDLKKIVDRSFKILQYYVRNHQELNDENALELITNHLFIDADYVKLRQSYMPKFLKALPARKLARYYQLENKFYAIVFYDMAARIPLIK